MAKTMFARALPFVTASFPPPGAFARSDGSVEWTVWAPDSRSVDLILFRKGKQVEYPMTRDEFGHFSARLSGIYDGARYAFRLEEDTLPDPASRWQPEGVHAPSAVFVPDLFDWSDHAWIGIPREELVLYEMHVGTFTPEGTLDAAIDRLAELKDLGVTAVELMPLAQFAGERNWGYDGVYPYAVQNTYGGPRALQRFVDAAHGAGLAVFLDVVYNHLGPEGNYLARFGPYFTDRYKTPWGEAVNFDGPRSDPVRTFFVENAKAWIRDFHLDGLRLDAVHAILDSGARHILADIRQAVKEAGDSQSRSVYAIAETTQNDVRLIDPRERHGYALDGVWNDDFHHAVRAVLTGERDGYYQDFGHPEHLVKSLNDVFVYDGYYSPFRRRCHGSKVGDRDRRRFVTFVQNHDQVGNRAMGDRLSTRMPPAANRLALGLLMINPCVPLLFMGQEYGERRPFPFFTSFSDPELVAAVREGRRREFASLDFEWDAEIPDPDAVETFLSAKLSWEWPEGSEAARFRRLVRDLLLARKEWAPLVEGTRPYATLLESARRDEAPLGPAGVVLVIQHGIGQSLLAPANLGPEPVPLPPAIIEGRDLLLSTEWKRYGGERGYSARGDLDPYEMAFFGRKE